MKTSTKVFLTVFTLSMSANAQVTSTYTDLREKLVFGVKAGTNFSNVYDSKGEDFRADAKFGLAAGLYVAIPIGPIIGIHPEVLISQKGFKGSGSLLGASYEYTHTTTYLDIPLYFALKPSESVTILAGPQFSYLVKSRDVFGSGVNSYAQEQEFENDDIRKNTMSMSVGVDVNLEHFVIGGRAAWDFLDNKSDGTSETPRYKNQWVQLTVDYRFYAN